MQTSTVAFGIIVSLALSTLLGSDDENSRVSLRGIKSFGVSVEPSNEAEEKVGVTTAQLRTAIELCLRQSGIAIEEKPKPGTVVLYLTCAMLPRDAKEGGGAVYSLELAVDQPVVVHQNGENIIATTWSVSSTHDVGAQAYRDSIISAVTGHAKTFANAYLAVNPKLR